MGFSKFYAVTAKTAGDPTRAAAAWKFINFMAGKPYVVAKRWAAEKGLGFGQLPLFEDPAVIEMLRKYDMFPRYMNTADYTKSVGGVIAQEKAALEIIGLLKKD